MQNQNTVYLKILKISFLICGHIDIDVIEDDAFIIECVCNFYNIVTTSIDASYSMNGMKQLYPVYLWSVQSPSDLIGRQLVFSSCIKSPTSFVQAFLRG